MGIFNIERKRQKRWPLVITIFDINDREIVDPIIRGAWRKDTTTKVGRRA